MDLFTDETLTVKSILLRCSATAPGDRSITWGHITGAPKHVLYCCKKTLRICSVSDDYVRAGYNLR